MGKTYGNIANKYAWFVLKLYGIANIVFDGYRVGVTLKDYATFCPWYQFDAVHNCVRVDVFLQG